VARAARPRRELIGGRPRLVAMPPERHPEPPRLPRSLPGLEFRGSIEDGESFREGAIVAATCVDAHVAAVEFTEVMLRDPDFTGSVLTDAAFRDTVLENAKLANTTLRGGSLTRVLVDGGRLTGIQVAETEIEDCVWRGCGADMASFRHAKLGRTTFEDCSLREADFMGLRGDWVRFHDCDLRGAGFAHAQFTSSEFRRCRMDDVEGVEGLRGTAMELEQMLTLAPALARALGVSLIDE
jgi:uncharacterized protein YjbI with pentapeptide repeats